MGTQQDEEWLSKVGALHIVPTKALQLNDAGFTYTIALLPLLKISSRSMDVLENKPCCSLQLPLLQGVWNSS